MIRVVPYDESWPARAGQLIEHLQTELPGVFRQLEHIGSTSVPGLAAKPIVDLMASVRALDDVSAHQEALRRLGFVAAETGMPNRLFYTCPADGAADGASDDRGGRPDCNLHVVTADTWAERNERLLRDHLRAHPEDARAYGELKERLASTGLPGEEYGRAKTELIQRLVDRARDARGLPRVPVWEE